MDRERNTTWTWIILGGLTVLLLVFALPYIPGFSEAVPDVDRTQEEDRGLFGEEPRATPAGELDVSEIVNNPEAYVGQAVTVSGTKADFFTNQMFTMSGSVFTDNLLIVSQNPIPQLEPELINDVYRVNGMIQMMNADDIERVMGMDLSEDLARDYRDSRPVLIANQVERIEDR
jgi:hypothetical protein